MAYEFHLCFCPTTSAQAQYVMLSPETPQQPLTGPRSGWYPSLSVPHHPLYDNTPSVQSFKHVCILQNKCLHPPVP